MTVIAEITVPVDALSLGTVIEDVPESKVELERVVPVQGGIMPLFWASGAGPDAIEASLGSIPETESFDRLTTANEKTLFEVRWSDEIDGVLQPLIDTGGRVLNATGTSEGWELRLLFESHEKLSVFNVAATDRGIPITLNKVHNPAIQRDDQGPSADDSFPSSTHTETLLAAYRNGYYEVPRRVQLEELAEKENVSDSALSKRLRRAMAGLIEYALLSEAERSEI